MKYEVVLQDGVFEVVTRGDAEVLKFAEYLDETVRHEDWKPGMPVLHDHSELNSGPLTIHDVHRIAGYCADLSKEYGDSRLAVVLRRDLEFGLTRMWEAFVEEQWDATAGVFRSREEAIHWLKQERSREV